jgi:hypothetical protein
MTKTLNQIIIFRNMVFLTTKFTTVDVNIHASNRQKWYRHPTKENTKVRPEMTKFKMFREKVSSRRKFLRSLTEFLTPAFINNKT